MTRQDIEKAASLLAVARRDRQPLSRLPEDCRPATLEEAFAIEEATVAQLGEEAGAREQADGPLLGHVHHHGLARLA